MERPNSFRPRKLEMRLKTPSGTLEKSTWSLLPFATFISPSDVILDAIQDAKSYSSFFVNTPRGKRDQMLVLWIVLQIASLSFVIEEEEL